jgi:hypothetical protein
MSEYVIAQRDFFTQAPVDSPAVFKNMGRFSSVMFQAGAAITKVEVSTDGTNYIDITADTALVDLTVAGLAVMKYPVSFKEYRITSSGQKITVNAN